MAIVSALACGCSSENDPARPPTVPAGRIQGTVRTGESLIDARIRATRIPDETQALAITEVDAEPSGVYSMDVPAGRYLVAAEVSSRAYSYRADGLVPGHDRGDTMVVDAHSPLNADFRLASLLVQFEFPRSADSLTVGVALWGPHGTFGSSQGTVLNGTAEVTIPAVLPGTYKAEVVLGRIDYACDCPWDGEHFWIPGIRDSTGAETVDLAVNRTSSIECRVDAEFARIEGQIGGPWQELGLAPPAVALFAPDSSVVRGFRRVDEGGGFEASVFFPAPVKLAVEHQGVTRWIGGDSFENAREFLLENGETIPDVRFDESVLALEFLPTDLRIGQPHVFVHDRATMAVVASIRYAFLQGATVAVPNLPIGEYVVFVDTWHGHQSWIPQWVDRVSRPQDAQTIGIPSDGSFIRVPVVIEVGGRIEGAVENASEGSRYLFYLTRADDPTRWALGFGGVTHQEFDFEGVPDGDWKVGAWRDAGEFPDEAPSSTVWYPSTLDWTEAGTISLRDASTVTDVQIDLP